MMTNNSNNSNHNNSQFNAAPILLRHPSSFMMDNNLMYQQDAKNYQPSSPLYDSEPVMDDVPQRLAPEQYQYEFPPKSHLQALSMQLDQSIEDSISFFDASSFTTTTCTTSSTTSSSRVSSVVTDDFNAQEDQEFNSFLATLELEQYQQQQVQHQHQGFSLSPPPPIEVAQSELVNDRQLSPLQLPQQAESQMPMMSSATRVREESYDSISTITQPIVAPASFLSHHHHQQQQYNDGYSYSDDDDDDDDQSMPMYQSQIEWHDTFGTHPSLWQDTFDDSYDSIHPHHRLSEDQDLPVIRRESEMVLTDSDNSMMTDDDESSNFSSGSKVVLFKLSKKTKMASPYIPKRNTSTSPSSDEGYDDNDDYDDEKELPIESASVFLPLDDHQLEDDDDEDDTNNSPSTVVLLKQHQQQIDRLEAQLREEKAMRTAFEKAMEEMVLLMDQQQKMLYDRVEQEVTMRQLYEKKMEDALTMVAPLEQKLKKETDARCELESMMSHVLGELQDIKSTQQQQQQQQVSSRPNTHRSTTTTTATTITSSSRSSRTNNTNVKRSIIPSSKTTTTPSSITRTATNITSSVNEKRSLGRGSSQRLRSTTPASSKSSFTKKQQHLSSSSTATTTASSSRIKSSASRLITTSRPTPPSSSIGRKRQL